MILIEYLRVLTAGVASRLWRWMTGGPCVCEICRQQHVHARKAERVERETALPTVDEVRHRRYR